MDGHEQALSFVVLTLGLIAAAIWLAGYCTGRKRGYGEGYADAQRRYAVVLRSGYDVLRARLSVRQDSGE